MGVAGGVNERSTRAPLYGIEHEGYVLIRVQGINGLGGVVGGVWSESYFDTMAIIGLLQGWVLIAVLGALGMFRRKFFCLSHVDYNFIDIIKL